MKNFLTPLFIAFALTAYSQTKKALTGTVYSGSTKQPIPGASVTSKSTGKTLISDEAGNFMFPNVVDSDTLAISSIGYHRREIPVLGIGQNPLAVYLDLSISQIDEVEVNTGYQSLPKERATGSFTHIDNELFNRSVSTDLISRLEGITNGLDFEMPVSIGAPSSSPNLRIRGVSTIRGERAPLIVVDNFPYEGDISNINPNDVESITVLKDAAASSIWGARAGNGVIVVTTKSGLQSRKPTLNVNSNVSFIDKPDLHYSPIFLPPGELVELESMLFDRGLYTKNDWTSYTPAIEIRFAQDEGRIDETTANKMLDDLKRYDVRDEASKYLYRQSVNQQYAMNVNGGAESYQYYISAGFDNNAAHLVGDGTERVTLSARNDFQPLPKLNISTSLNYVLGRSTSNGISLLDLNPTDLRNPYVYARLADESGNALPIAKNNRFTYVDNAPEMGLLDWHYRPLEELRINDNTSGSQEVRVNTAVGYKLWKGLLAEVRYQYQTVGGSVRRHYLKESYFVRDLVNRFTQADGTRPVPLGGILDRSNRTFASHYGRFQVDYNDRWAERHELSGVAGMELRQERNSLHGGTRLYGYDDEILTHVGTLNFDDGFLTLPRQTAARIPNGNSSGTHTVDRFVSYYANLGYTYDAKYMLSASTRWDASNIFGVDFNRKGVPLWSIGWAWNVSNEAFFAVDWVNHAKLRATYGSNGNAVRTLSALPYIWYNTTNLVTGLPSGNLQSVGNPDLRWEQVDIVNLGLDFSLFGDRVSGSVEWYNKSSSDLIGEDIFDPTTGIIPSGLSYSLDSRRNYANLNTKGFDIELNTVNTDRGLKWQTTFLFSSVKNMVTEYRNLQTPLATNFFNPEATRPLMVNHPIDQLYALPWHGLDGATGAPLVMAGDELGTDYNAYFSGLGYDDLLKIGVSMPPFFGSVLNTFSWKSLSVSANILWKGGHKFRRESINYSSLLGSYRMTHVDYLNRWRKPGDELTTNVPSLPESANTRRDQSYSWSEALIEKGDHIRLQDISVSYRLPDGYVRNIGLSQVQLYAYASNLGLLWKYTDYNLDPGVNALYPKPLQISFGLKIQL